MLQDFGRHRETTRSVHQPAVASPMFRNDAYLCDLEAPHLIRVSGRRSFRPVFTVGRWRIGTAYAAIANHSSLRVYQSRYGWPVATPAVCQV